MGRGGSVGRVLSTQKLPRVASRGREVGKNVDKHRLGVNAECTQKSQIKCAEHLENLLKSNDYYLAHCVAYCSTLDL